MTAPHPDAPPSDEWDHISAVPRTTALFGVASRGPRRFASLTRTIGGEGFMALDAIDTDGRAWRILPGIDPGPKGIWAEIKPLPTYEEQP